MRGACEILGLDPLYVANEGRFLAILPAEQAEAALAILSEHAVSVNAALIGSVSNASPGTVTLRSQLGTRRVLDRLSGEQLPRIC